MQAEVGQHLVLHADEQAVVAHAARPRAGQRAAALHRHELHVGCHFHRGCADLVKGGALELAVHHVLGRVQRGGVEVVGRVVLHLQPVAVLEVAVGHEFVAGQHGEVAFPLGEGRLFLGRAHVGEHQAVALEGLVGALADRAGVALGVRLFALGEGHLEAGAVDVEHHAVVAAHDPALLDRAVFERRTAVHAVRVQQADAPALVAKGHQFLAQDHQKVRRVGELHRHADRLPEAAHVLARGRARPHLGQLGVVTGDLVGVVPAVGDQLLLHRCGGAGRALAVVLVHGLGHAVSPSGGGVCVGSELCIQSSKIGGIGASVNPDDPDVVLRPWFTLRALAAR